MPALELLFNTILANGEYPSKWVTGIIYPLYKKGDHRVPDDIITEKSQACLVLENYLHLYLITDSFFKTKYVMIMIPIKLVSKTICFVDFTFEITFDYIDRTALYYKMLNRGIDGN